jgi:hypothetical protein
MRQTILGLALLGISIPTAVFGQVADQVITANTQTEASEIDGTRKSSASEWSELTAPAGHAIAKESVTGGITSSAGSENRCETQFSENVNVLPNFPQPTKFKLRAHSYSSPGSFGGGGHTNCRYVVPFVTIQR